MHVRHHCLAVGIVVAVVVSAGLVVFMNPGPVEWDISALFGGSDMQIAREGLLVALLFNYSLPQHARALAGLDRGVVYEVARFLLSNPHAAENLFTEVLHDTVNHIGVDIQSSLFPSLSSQGVSLSSAGTRIDLGLYNYNRPGRELGVLEGASLRYGLSQDTEESYLISSFNSVPPIVLDLDGDGILQASNGQWLPHPDIWSSNIKMFDIDGDGLRDIMEWVGPNDGLLINVLPMQDTSLSGKNLFGDSDGWPDGYEKLRSRDLDSNGVIEGQELDGLYVWRDADQNAVTSPSEVSSASSLGVTSISLGHKSYRSTMIMNNMVHSVWDWYPNSIRVLRRSDAINPQIPTLSAYAAPALGAGPGTGLSGFSLAHQTLVSMGIDGAQLVCVTDEGSVVLLQRTRTAALHSEGRHRELIVLNSDSVSTGSVRRIPLPVCDVTNVFLVPDKYGAIVIADCGSKILQVDFTDGTTKTL
ncbi:MAG: hypothetical protein QXS20_01265 [Candidatus Thorarchaeota archaeon]